MNNHHYETESHMRANHPHIANHLCTIASLINGRMVARMDGVSYSWNANVDLPDTAAQDSDSKSNNLAVSG